MKRLLPAGLIAAVVVLHQDFWLWKDARSVLGFLPIGFAYHVGYCLLAAFTLWALVRFAWPRGLEDDEAGRPPS